MTTKININTGTQRLRDAERLLEIASLDGSYKKFENTLVAFDRAIAQARDDVEERKAKKGKTEAVLAYARQALANKDLDLAASLVEPLVGCGRETELLKRLIKDKKFSYRLSGRDMRIKFPAVIAVTLVVLFVAIVNVYYYLKKVREENPHLGDLVASVDRALNASARSTIQYEVLAIHAYLLAPGNDKRLEDYEYYPEFKTLVARSAAMLADVQGNYGKTREKLHSHLDANLPLIAQFRHELVMEPEDKRRQQHVVLVQHLDELSHAVMGIVTEDDDGGTEAEMNADGP